jgi:hypothetical protein
VPDPPANDWRTTDQDEIRRRIQRAIDEKHSIRNLNSQHIVFSNFSVQSPSGMNYQVEIRDLNERAFSCTCPDFRINGLGTCKHVEATLIWLKRRFKGEFQLAQTPPPADPSLAFAERTAEALGNSLLHCQEVRWQNHGQQNHFGKPMESMDDGAFVMGWRNRVSGFFRIQ